MAIQEIKKVVTEKNSDYRLSLVEPLVMKEGSNSVGVTVTSTECQTMIGFGGAFTEAAAYTLSRVSADLREEAIKAYYDKESGLAYNIGRVHIHSCDFALGNYTYVEKGDELLATFNIEHDEALILPLVRDAFKVRGEKLDILASPWSPPGWMKTNGEMNNGGKLKPEYFDTWALYYAKFIDSYEKAGIPIWGLTVQNEPAAVQIWDSCIYTAEDERDFIKNHLGPMLHNKGYENVKLFIWDHNRDIIVDRARTVLEDKEAAKYVYGTGFHWYVSEAFENVGEVHDLFPDKHLLFTEGCQEGGVKVGEWFTGERYGRNMIGDFNNWCEGYLDWNIVLDETGGPNHVNNLCDAPIIADTVENKLYYNSSYYYIGHFSKYVQAGAKRLLLEALPEYKPSTVEGQVTADAHVVAFVNPNGEIVVVAMNETDESQTLAVNLDRGYIEDTLKPHSIVTYIVNR